MSRRSSSGNAQRVQHGAVVDAPSEYGFVTSDSPPPGRVAPKAESAEPRGLPARSPLALLWAGLKLSLGLAVVASLSVAIAWGAHRYALTTPRFAVRNVDVKGNRHHSGGELARMAGVEMGKNLFTIDTADAERRLLESPWIRSARVGRVLPGTLSIEVSEREAVAAAIVEDTLYLVTAEGEPFKAVEDKDPSDLPVITGVGARDLAIDRARAVDRLSVGLEVLRDYAALPLSKVYEAEEVHLAPDGTVVLVVGKRGISLQLGTGPFRKKLLMAARVLGKLQAGGELPGIVFLDNEAHPERVVVRMR